MHTDRFDASYLRQLATEPKVVSTRTQKRLVEEAERGQRSCEFADRDAPDGEYDDDRLLGAEERAWLEARGFVLVKAGSRWRVEW